MNRIRVLVSALALAAALTLGAILLSQYNNGNLKQAEATSADPSLRDVVSQSRDSGVSLERPDLVNPTTASSSQAGGEAGESRAAVTQFSTPQEWAEEYKGFSADQLKIVIATLELDVHKESVRICNTLFDAGQYETVVKPKGEGVDPASSFPDGSPRFSSVRATNQDHGRVEYRIVGISPYDYPQLMQLHEKLQWLNARRLQQQ